MRRTWFLALVLASLAGCGATETPYKTPSETTRGPGPAGDGLAPATKTPNAIATH
jgi:hypothetical protein